MRATYNITRDSGANFYKIFKVFHNNFHQFLNGDRITNASACTGVTVNAPLVQVPRVQLTCTRTSTPSQVNLTTAWLRSGDSTLCAAGSTVKVDNCLQSVETAACHECFSLQELSANISQSRLQILRVGPTRSYAAPST